MLLKNLANETDRKYAGVKVGTRVLTKYFRDFTKNYDIPAMIYIRHQP